MGGLQNSVAALQRELNSNVQEFQLLRLSSVLPCSFLTFRPSSNLHKSFWNKLISSSNHEKWRPVDRPFIPSGRFLGSRLTFGREDALLVTGAVDQLNVELLWDGVDRGDLVRPCAIVDDQPVRVGCVLLVCEEAYSLDECTFHLC
jgi:hypothetical protein